jgi:hypothetical protein
MLCRHELGWVTVCNDFAAATSVSQYAPVNTSAVLCTIIDQVGQVGRTVTLQYATLYNNIYGVQAVLRCGSCR